MQEPAERLFPNRADFHRDADAVDLGFVQAPFRLAIAAGGALEHFASRGNGFAELGMGPGIERILKQDLGGVGDGSGRIERGVRQLVHPVHRRRKGRTASTCQWRCAAKFANRHMTLKACFCAAAYCKTANKASMYRLVNDQGQKSQKVSEFHGEM